MQNHMDVSPCFTRADKTPAQLKLLMQIVEHEATPEAIKVFDRNKHRLTDYNYWFMLGVLWVSYTGWSDLELWKTLFKSSRPNREEILMNPSELKAFDNLPRMFHVYRTHRDEEKDWIAYTIDLKKASDFAVRRGVGKVSAYRVNREDALCLFLRRGEFEILILDKTKATKIHDVMVLHQPEEVKVWEQDCQEVK